MIPTPYKEHVAFTPRVCFILKMETMQAARSEYKIYILQNAIAICAVRVGAPIQCFLITIPLTIDFKGDVLCTLSLTRFAQMSTLWWH